MATPAPPRLPASERLRRAGIGAWSIIGILILAAIFVWALLRIRVIFPPLVLAILVVYVLNPLVTRLQRAGVPRLAGTLGAYVVLLGGLALVVIAVIPLVSEQMRDFSRSWPELRNQTLEFVDGNAGRLESVGALVQDGGGEIGVDVGLHGLDALLAPARAAERRRLPEPLRRLRPPLHDEPGP